MDEHAFFYKDLRHEDDRDAVKYLELEDGKIKNLRLTGPCFSTSLEYEKPQYDKVATIFTKEEFKKLIEFDKEDNSHILSNLDVNEECPFINKLLSDENKSFTEQIMDEEREYLCEKWGLTDKELDEIFDAYPYDYRDRGIISTIWDSIEDAAYDEAESMGYVTKANERWFDYEKFGEDLLDSEGYYQMEDGRVVYFSL